MEVEVEGEEEDVKKKKKKQQKKKQKKQKRRRRRDLSIWFSPDGHSLQKRWESEQNKGWYS